ncbi:permease [Nitrincola sp. A-D6]|uniref:LPS export ABC transporter permease LptF n=1 Tax=Nitrincola sp. A-D6 TaxID=1545442 RepID=UPI00051F8C28|nr:LPS export ABC transporter permease LptF [Nitrincola sp. A-D6]KGK43065.1 permease [Nitrincola sp. A-D6]
MIIFRYITREVLVSTLAVTAVLMLIITSARLIKYLTDAAAGKLEAGAVFLVLLYRMPGFLELLLPLGLFLGILLALGRLCLDSEMVVLRATGFSGNRLLSYVFGPALVVSLLVLLLSAWISPLGLNKADQLLAAQDARSELDLVTPGRFLSQSSGQVTYAEALEGEQLKQVFIAQRGEDGRPNVLIAESAERRLYPEAHQRFLVLLNGYRFDGRPGEAEMSRIRYSEYGVQLDEPELAAEIREVDAKPTRMLMASAERRDLAALHWRFSLPVLVLVVTLLAVPLSYTNPRQGRFAKLIPSVLLYLAYMALLTTARSQVESGGSPVILWFVHLVFMFVAGNFLYLGRYWHRLFSYFAPLKRWIPGRKTV